ncbi:MAG: DUF1772 domain-containing protein [Actinomycetia bacterium]|nr:DUF1772 domain-containing protein [Actinomycetes bacterium]
MSLLFVLLATFSALAYGVLAGVFLAFSDFIMRSLAQISDGGGLEAMQAVNREVFRTVFMVLFIGMAPLSVVLTVHELVWDDGTAALMIAAAGLIYVLGCVGVTVGGNVPLNQELDRMGLGREAAETFWRDTYVPRWTFWNTIRACACAISATLVILGLAWPL